MSIYKAHYTKNKSFLALIAELNRFETTNDLQAAAAQDRKYRIAETLTGLS